MTGLIAPNSGKITLNGIDITSFPVYRRARLGIGYLPQEASIFRKLSVEDNIKLVLELNDKFIEAIKTKKDEEITNTIVREGSVINEFA